MRQLFTSGLRRSTVIAAVAMTLLGLFAAPSHASTGPHTLTYTKKWTFKSSPLKRCVFITAKGNFTYKTKEISGKPKAIKQWYDQKLNDATLYISVSKMGTKGRCLTPAKLSKVTMRQSWKGYACDYNPSLSVGVPFSIGVSAWPNCGNKRQAFFETTYEPNRSSYTQYNSKSYVKFAKKGGTAPCYGVFPSITIYVGSSSDSFGATDTASGKVCLPY